MKKRNRRLGLNRETLHKLNDFVVQAAAGGFTQGTCATYNTHAICGGTCGSANCSLNCPGTDGAQSYCFCPETDTVDFC